MTIFTRRLLLVLWMPVLLFGLIGIAARKNFPVLQDLLSDKIYGNITVARPLITYRDLVVVFADTRTYHAGDLALRIARSGAAVAIVDSGRAMKALSDGRRCLNADRVMESMGILANWAKAPKETPSILAGIGDGGLLPLLAAGTKTGGASRNLSVDFSAVLSQGYRPCSSDASATRRLGHQELISSPVLNGRWLAVWTDQPGDHTAGLVRGLSGAETEIASYDTPLDTVAVQEIQKMMTAEKQSPPLAGGGIACNPSE